MKKQLLSALVLVLIVTTSWAQQFATKREARNHRVPNVIENQTPNTAAAQGGGGGLFCDEAQGTAGFPDDVACQTAVCTIDPFCCNTEWDAICASEAAVTTECASCLSPLVTPDNDLCANAETLVCGVPTTGTTVGATDTGSPTDCSAEASTLGVWYTFVGTGGGVKLSTCGSTTATNPTPWFTVYSGDCNNFVCVVNVSGPDADCGTANSVALNFTSDAGVIYYVFLTASSSAPATVDFDLTLTCDPVTGITENGMEEINIYPNPSNGQFVVEVAGVKGDAQIAVMDVTGRQVYTEGVIMNGSFRKELNLNVAKGTYLLQISTAEGLVTHKIQIH